MALNAVVALRPQWVSRLQKGEKSSANPTVRKLDISNVPNLANLSLTGRALQELRFRTADLQFFGVSSEYLTPIKGQLQQNLPVTIGQTGRSKIYEGDIPLSIRQRWKEELGRNTGPANVDLSWLDLRDVDLSALRNNAGLRELDLNHTFVTDEQLAQLHGTQSLEKLILGGYEWMR